MSEFDSHKWTRQFKEASADRLNEKVKKENRLNEFNPAGHVLPFISNIDQKWEDSEDMQDDLRAWIQGIFDSGGYDLLDDVVSALEVEVKLYRQYRNKMQQGM